MDSRNKKVIAFYAHDFRDMKLNEYRMEEMLEGFVEALHCQHVCTSNCRREGCKCACGEYHF